MSPCASKANEEQRGIDEPGITQRRNVLRGALAAAGSLLLPAALMGCDAGKEAGSAGNDSAAMADPASAGLPEAEQAKVSQASVQYQTQPNGEQNCASCMYFVVESNTCKKVDGDISSVGWCVLWTKADLSRSDRRDGKSARGLA
jgi:hypothetical protein